MKYREPAALDCSEIGCPNQITNPEPRHLENLIGRWLCPEHAARYLLRLHAERTPRRTETP